MHRLRIFLGDVKFWFSEVFEKYAVYCNGYIYSIFSRSFLHILIYFINYTHRNIISKKNHRYFHFLEHSIHFYKNVLYKKLKLFNNIL